MNLFSRLISAFAATAVQNRAQEIFAHDKNFYLAMQGQKKDHERGSRGKVYPEPGKQEAKRRLSRVPYVMPEPQPLIKPSGPGMTLPCARGEARRKLRLERKRKQYGSTSTTRRKDLDNLKRKIAHRNAVSRGEDV